jgi:hypothetical protein
MSIDVEPDDFPQHWTRELCVGFLPAVAIIAAGLLAIF